MGERKKEVQEVMCLLLMMWQCRVGHFQSHDSEFGVEQQKNNNTSSVLNQILPNKMVKITINIHYKHECIEREIPCLNTG